MIVRPLCPVCGVKRLPRKRQVCCSMACDRKRRRFPRRICLHCKTKPVSKVANRYCSTACGYAGRRKPKALCPVCGERPISRQRDAKTCSRSCGALARGPEGQATRRRAQQIATAASHALHVKRIAESLRGLLAPLDGLVSMKDLLPVAVKVYRHGVTTGRKAAYYKYVISAQARTA